MNDLEDEMSKKTCYRHEIKAGKWLRDMVQSFLCIGNVQGGRGRKKKMHRFGSLDSGLGTG